MFDIKEVYNDYISHKNDEYLEKYKDNKGKFSASSAGTCFKKQYYNSINAPKEDMKRRSKRLLRLGTIVHKDLELAIKYHINNYKHDNIEILTEHEITIPHLNVIGHLDLATVTENAPGVVKIEKSISISVYDFKTIGSYQWRKRFGTKYGEKNPSIHYYMQLGTYAIGLANEYDPKPVSEIALWWYNKDDSKMKYQFVNPSYIDMAHEYWSDLNEFITEYGDEILNMKPPGPEIPVQSWECNYCAYEGMCKKGMI